MSDGECKPTRQVDRSAQNQRALLWLALACVALNLVGIWTLYLIWRGIQVVREQEQGLKQSDQTIRDIESRLLHMETTP